MTNPDPVTQFIADARESYDYGECSRYLARALDMLEAARNPDPPAEYIPSLLPEGERSWGYSIHQKAVEAALRKVVQCDDA